MSYNVYRWYQSTVTRYNRVDPIDLPAFRHPYAYASSNPLFYADPAGLQQVPPLPGRRDPFVPPFDPSFPSGPWGNRPNSDCCDRTEVERRIPRTKILEEDPSQGTGVLGQTMRSLRWEGGPWYSPEPIGPFDPGCMLENPCLAFCCRVHEWVHFSDRRWVNLNWDDKTWQSFTEGPAYGVERACLRSFL